LGAEKRFKSRQVRWPPCVQSLSQADAQQVIANPATVEFGKWKRRRLSQLDAALIQQSRNNVGKRRSSAASGLIGGTVSTASSALGGAGKVIGGAVQTAVQTAAPSLNNMNDPMATIENKVRSASGGQDPGALRDAAATAVRGALSGEPAQQAAATDKAADALAKAQNIPPDQAKAQVEQYQQQYKETVGQAKTQAKQVADTTAKTVSRGALFGALALLLGALAAFFAGGASAVTPTVTSGSGRSFA
jgi:hypothetical protein